ncbi:MAG: LysR family transcriptional regulator [Xanthobacteraceae bacterium]|nr:LysR family transcriptional regulator [Xanthobacteraceae bacterium]
MNWDDLRVIAAIRDEGTFAGASARLQIDETTVARRLERMQRALGVRLFEAVDGVRRPTAPCEEILAHVQEINAHVARIARIGEPRAELAGRFRIAATNIVAEDILAPRLEGFLARHPGMTLQLLTSSDNVKFSRWQADFAIRLRKPDKGDFTIARLATIRLYLIEPADGVAASLTCCYPPELDHTPEMEFLAARGLRPQARLVTDNLRVIATALRSHRATGVLPDYACRELMSDDRLRLTPLPRGREAWLLVQNHLRQDRAARAVIAFIRDCFRDPGA